MDVSKDILQEIADNLDTGFRSFINKETCEIVSYPNEDQHIYMDIDDWKDEIKKIKKAPKKFIEIEAMNSAESFNIMENFIDQIDDMAIKNRLLQAIEGHKPFANFKMQIDRSGKFREDWFKFKNESLLDWVKNQLDF